MQINNFFLILELFIVLYFIGYGFTSLFLPKNLYKDSFWYMPIVGLILLINLGIALIHGRMSLIPGIYFILFITSFLLIYSILQRKNINFFNKRNLIYLLFIIAIASISILPLDFSTFIYTSKDLLEKKILSSDIMRLFLQKNSLIAISPTITFLVLLTKNTLLVIIKILPQIYLIILLLSLYILFKNIYENKSKFLILSSIFLLLLFLYNTFILKVVLTYFIYYAIIIFILMLLDSYSLKNTYKWKDLLTNFTQHELIITLSLVAVFAIQPALFIPTAIFLLVISIVAKFLFNKSLVWLLISKTYLWALIINPMIWGIAVGVK